MFAAQYLDILKPKSFITSGGYGTMGFALPAAIGAYFAAPQNTTLAIDGDASLLMNIGELFTIGKYKLPIKVLLLNNHGENMVRNYQNFVHDSNYVATEKVTNVNFADVAKDMNFQFSRRITKKDDLRKGLVDFIDANGPCFLEVVCDFDETLYPRVPSGKGYKDMDLGPYITSE